MNRDGWTRQRIEHEAWKQFRDVGYDATTYASIARACGVGRSLVQYHFPRKEDLPTSLLAWVLEESQHVLGIDETQLMGNHVEFYKVGCCAFGFLLGNWGFQDFMMEILASRNVTETLNEYFVQWNIERISKTTSITDKDIDRTIVMSMGAFYDYIFHCLMTGREFDVFGSLANLTYMSAVALEGTGSYQASDFRRDPEFVNSINMALRALAQSFESIVNDDRTESIR